MEVPWGSPHTCCAQVSVELFLVVAMETVVALTFARLPVETGYYKVMSAGAPQDALRLSDTQCLDVLPSSGTGLTRPWSRNMTTIWNFLEREIKTIYGIWFIVDLLGVKNKDEQTHEEKIFVIVSCLSESKIVKEAFNDPSQKRDSPKVSICSMQRWSSRKCLSKYDSRPVTIEPRYFELV